eukprot:2669811-Prymnesium_polylepis.1
MAYRRAPRHAARRLGRACGREGVRVVAKLSGSCGATDGQQAQQQQWRWRRLCCRRRHRSGQLLAA